MSLTKVTYAMIQGAAYSVLDFGATGNGTTDDTTAIQAALDYAGNNGGGTVVLPQTNGKYRITSGLKIPSFVCLEGDTPSSFPYDGSSASSSLLADFTNVNQWVIDTKTTVGGNPVAYNAFVTGLPDGATFNCSIRNLQINAVNTIPYGAIRMQGCPGAIVENVSSAGTGTGLLVNGCWDGVYRFHSESAYYGTIVYGGTSANSFDIVAVQSQVSGSLPTTVPSGYLMPFMNSLNGSMVSVLKLSTEDHYNRPWGLITAGTSESLPNNNSFDIDIEQFSGGWFSYYGYSSVFNRMYFEGDTNNMDFAVVSAYSNWVSNSCHAYLSGTGALVDLGTHNNIYWSPIGLKNYASWGYGPYADVYSLMTISGVSPDSFGPSTPQFNMFYTSGSVTSAVTVFQNSWTYAGTPYQPLTLVLEKQTNTVNIVGVVQDGTAPSVAFVLPTGYRPLYTKNFSVFGGTVKIEPNGNVTILSGSVLDLDGIYFTASP